MVAFGFRRGPKCQGLGSTSGVGRGKTRHFLTRKIRFPFPWGPESGNRQEINIFKSVTHKIHENLVLVKGICFWLRRSLDGVLLADFGELKGTFSDGTLLGGVVYFYQSKAWPEAFVPFKVIQQ